MNNYQLLRPLDIGQILDKALRLQRANFGLLSGIVAAALIPIDVLKVISILAFNSTTLVDLAQNIFVSSLVTLALVSEIASIYLEQPISISEAYQKGTSRLLTMIGANFLMGIAIGLPALAIGFCGLTAGEFVYAGFIVLVPVIVFLSTRWDLAAPSILLEELGASDGLRRSWDLTAGYFWRVLATSFFAGLMVLLFSLLPVFVINYGLSSLISSPMALQILSEVIGTLISIIVMPFSVAVMTVLYYDLRVRKEGYDLELMAKMGEGS